MTEAERIAELERLLREEREFRHAAERRVESLTEKADVWRRRAEERAQRIERLLAEVDLPAVRRLAGRLRRAVRRPPQERATQSTGLPPAARSSPVVPTVRAAACVTSPDLAPVVTAMDTVELGAAVPDPLRDADVVVVEPAALSGLPEAARRRFDEWLHLDARQPLVVWCVDDGYTLPGPLRPDDVLAARSRGDVEALRHRAGRHVHHLGGTFDAALYTPATRRMAPDATTQARHDGAVVGGDADVPTVWVTSDLLADPPSWLLELAATAVPVVVGAPDVAPAGWAGASARRWAYGSHAPWVRACEMLRLAGVAFPDPAPSVAALVVSRRPDDVPAAIGRVSRQTHRPLELVVGLHGVPRTPAIDAAVAAAGLPVTLLELDAAWTLGECLNEASSHTGASFVAKIDDDDHYGPAYLEDALQAVRYSGAEVVVKAAQFTYLAARDVTVLRRARQEETMLDGSTAGATFVVRRGVWDTVRFPHRTRGEDIRFLRGARAAGATVYANSRWEFCYVRRSEHTWTAADETFHAGALPAWDGFHPERVEVPALTAGS